MNRFTRITLGVLALLLLLWGTAYAWRSYSNRKKVQQLLATLTNRPQGGRPDREAFQAVRKEVDALPKAYQQQFRTGMRDNFAAMMQKRMDDYFKLSKEDRIKELDKRIAEEEKRRKEWEQRRKEREAAAKLASSNGSTGKNGQSSGNNNSGNNNSGGNASDGNGRGGGWGGNRGLSARLDNTTPQFRAQMATYRMDMAQRRAALGIPPRPPRHQYL